MSTGDNSTGAGSDECPVCYETLKDNKRTLSCGHGFCHDCLVKTLVGANRSGHITRHIICPMCRHLTFLTEQGADVVKVKSARKDAQILEVTLSPPPPVPPFHHPLPPQSPARHAAGRAPPRAGDSGASRAVRFFRRASSRRVSSRPPGPAPTLQIFTITSQGRPMADEDAVSVTAVTSVIPVPRRRSRLTCATARWVLTCLVAVIVAAVVIAVIQCTMWR
nr:PREDICTED: RING finger protein 222 [Lepisosteus oculatus]